LVTIGAILWFFLVLGGWFTHGVIYHHPPPLGWTDLFLPAAIVVPALVTLMLEGARAAASTLVLSAIGTSALSLFLWRVLWFAIE
jgi:hypothetical protein